MAMGILERAEIADTPLRPSHNVLEKLHAVDMESVKVLQITIVFVMMDGMRVIVPKVCHQLSLKCRYYNL